MRGLLFAALAVALAAAQGYGGGRQTFGIDNPLGLDWPWELVHFDVPAGTVRGDAGVRIAGEVRPAQVEALEDGRQRVWFVATVKGSDRKAEAVLQPGKVASPLRVEADGDFLRVGNGVYEIRVPNFTGRFDRPKPLKEVSPVFGGMKVQGDREFYGAASFRGETPVAGARTEVVARGPVFAVVRVTYDLETPADAELPSRYEATLKFVAGDPWVDVTEKYHVPDSAYTIEFREGLRPDTVMWVRWFNYEQFGGNSSLNFHPLRPQARQRGPFVIMRPVWNQQPGGGQDFFVTRGGERSGDAPAVGVVAVRPMDWSNPFAQTIGAAVENGDTARVTFPLNTGGRGYALVVGPRDRFDSTDRLNSLVRRHADWRLDDQIHEYILEWERDPALAGPNILLSRRDLERLRRDYRSGKDTPETKVIKEFVAKKDRLEGLDRDLLKLIVGEPAGGPRLPSARLILERRYQDDFFNPTTHTRAIKRAFPGADLLSDGGPVGGPEQAALGYIFSDLNQWPGYENGWSAGNPNFHTDKYMVAVYAAALLRDHPHAAKWLAFGRKNFDEDAARVLLPPDGVGYECPGYSTYSLNLQLGLARVFQNAGQGNPIAENPLYKKTGLWHRHLLTPYDVRLKMRHQAPIGDTHRWGGDGHMFGMLARYYKDADPAFAAEMMGVWKMYRDQGMKGGLIEDLVEVDQSIPPTPLQEMAWGSHHFEGFGAVMRSKFGTPLETFVSFKAGRTSGHYHNDDLSYHFYGAGTPVSLDYNCSYSPRGDHAALHNSMTFGVEKPFRHVGADRDVRAQEQVVTRARVLAGLSTGAADLCVAERTADRLVLAPIFPEDAQYSYPYPTREVKPIVHRRFLTLVKHAEKSPLHDYLVVRDEIISDEPQQLNIHLLARDVRHDGPFLKATGQWDADMTVYLAAETKGVAIGRWYYLDQHGEHDGLDVKAWERKVRETDGEALIPPPGRREPWLVGEYQKWCRVHLEPGQAMTWVLYARKRGEPEPKFEILPGGVRVSLGEEVDEIHLSTRLEDGRGQAVIVQNGRTTELLAAKALPPLGSR